MTTTISRNIYADMYGPTSGDRVRLADTDLIIEVEYDLTHYGEEVKFGGGKESVMAWASQATRADGAVDTVITNALVIDVAGFTSRYRTERWTDALLARPGTLIPNQMSISLLVLEPRQLHPRGIF